MSQGTENPILFVVLDAFRWDYLCPETTPFLWRLKEEGVSVNKIRTAAGFTQRAAIFTGAWADVTGHWTMHCFDPERSPFKFLSGKGWLKWAEAVGSRLPGAAGRVFEGGIRSRIYRRARAEARHPATGRIPLNLLPFFSVSEDVKPVHEPGALGVPSIFDRIHEAGITFQYLMYPEVDGTDASTEAALIKGASDESCQVYFGLLSAADQAGHDHGPHGAETARACTRTDRRLERIDDAFRAVGRLPVWLVVGDHGMLEVTERVNALEILRAEARQNDLVEGEDWLAFCDSTSVKLWALTPAAEPFVKSAFLGLGYRGRILDAETAKQRRIPFGDRRYGDRVWLANPGVLIWPDYFHRRDEQVLGMHGYDPAIEGQKGMAVIHGPGVDPAEVEEAPLIDACATFCQLIGTPPPDRNEGRSWLPTHRTVEAR